MLSGYFWFVVGEMREGMVDLFRVRHRDKKESLLAGERLRLGRSWELAGIHRTKSNSFRIEDAIDVLLISGREPPVEIKVVKLDVMSSGLK